MKKKYLYNGEYYTESEMNDFAKQSGVSFDSYIAALGKDVKVLDAPYEYKGNFYTQDEISAAAKKKGINDDAYLSQNGIKKKEEAYTGGAMSSAASKIGGQVGNFVGQSEKDNALSLIQSINAGITKGIEKGKQQFPNEIRATPEEEAALRDAQRRTGQADGLFTQQGAEQFNLLATDPLRAILDPEREKLQTAYNNRRLQGVRQTSDNTIARNNIDPNKTVQKKDGKLIPDVSSNPEYQVKNQEQALENVSGLVKNKFFKNGKEALEYAENQVKSGIDPTGNETIEHAITKAGEYKQKEESALNGKSIIQNAIEIQLQNDPLFKKQYETIINGTASDAEIADVARRFNIPLDKLKTQGSLPQEVVGELVHRFISDPDIKQIAEDNPEFKKDFDNFTGDKIYEVFPEYADVYIKNTLSRARELDGKNNWFANPIFDKSKYMDNLAEEVFKDRPILLKRVKDKFHNNWEHKIETTGIVDDLATGARGAMSGMWRSLKDVSGFGESYSDRIRNTLKEQYGHVETPHQNEFRKVVGEASNFMGMVLAMGATGSGLGNIGKGLGVMNPSVASKAVTLATFFDDELNHAASIYPENPTKAYLRASLSTAFFLVAGDAIPASKITGFKQNITQTLKSLETKALDKQAKMKLRDKILSVATETLQGTAKGTAEMTVMINGFKLLIDRALGLDESSINNEYSDANLLATAKSMLFGLPVPSMIHGFKGINRTRAAIYEMASNPEKYKSAILKRFGSDDHRIADIDFIADFKKYLDSMRVAENEKAKMVFNALHAKRLREQKSPDAFMKRNHEEEIRAIEQEQQDIMDGKDSDAGLTDSQKAIKTAYENGEINEMMEAQIKEALKDPAKADQFIKEIAEQATGAVAPELGNAKDGAIKFFGETLTDFAIGKSGKKGGGESVVFEYENEGEVPQKLKPLMVKDENGRITITMPKDEADALQKRIAEGLEPDMELMDGTLIKKAEQKDNKVGQGQKQTEQEQTVTDDSQKNVDVSGVATASPVSGEGKVDKALSSVEGTAKALDAKKADIERRRQEELKNSKIQIPRYFTFKELGGAKGKSGKALSSIEGDRNEEIQQDFESKLQEGDKLIEPNGDIYYFKNGKVVKSNGQPRGVADIGAFINGVTIDRTDKINTKYDAELKALGQQPTSTAQSESNPALRDVESTAKNDELEQEFTKTVTPFYKTSAEKVVSQLDKIFGGIGNEIKKKFIEHGGYGKFLFSKDAKLESLKGKIKDTVSKNMSLDDLAKISDKDTNLNNEYFDGLKNQYDNLQKAKNGLEAVKKELEKESLNKERGLPPQKDFYPIYDIIENMYRTYGMERPKFLAEMSLNELLDEYSKLDRYIKTKEADLKDKYTSAVTTRLITDDFKPNVNEQILKAVESLLSKEQAKEQTPPALRDVESTAKALDGSSLKGIVFADKNGVEKIVVQDNKGGGFLIKNNDGKPQNPTMGNHKDISEAYHKAKADGSNPELVKAVEELLGKKEEVKSEQKAEKPTEQKPTIEQQVKDFGVSDEMTKPVTNVVTRVFEGLKKAGLTAAKTVGDWVGIGKGEEKPYTLKINGKDVQVKNVQPEVVNGFYSPLEKIVNDSKFDKLPAKQWIEKYANSEEAKWTGLKDWLAQQQGSVSKADIQKYLKDNRIQVVEVVKGEDMPNYKLEVEPPSELGADRMDLLGDLGKAGNLDNPRFREYLNKKYGKNGNKIYDWLAENATVEGTYSKDTKFSEYVLKGEKSNYKEVLVTLPSRNKFDANKVEIKKKYNSATQGTFDIYYDGKLVKGGYDLFNNGSGRFGEKTDAELNETAKRIIETGDKFNKVENAQGNFISSHFDEPNILVHLRMNTRTDAEGNKVLFLEEVQSDWGQKGKKEGFGNITKLPEGYRIDEPTKFSKWTVVEPSGIDGNIQSTTIGQGETKEIAVQNALNNLNRRKTPSAPFVTDTNAWTKLGLKVALKEAVKQGADKIAWSTGTQQFDRWGSEEIHWNTVMKPKGFEIVVKDDAKRPIVRGSRIKSLSSNDGSQNQQAEVKRLAEKWNLKPEDLEVIPSKGQWTLAINEQTDAQAFQGNEEALRSNKLEESDISVGTKAELRDAIKRNLSRERNDAEIDKLTDRIWNRMQTEDSGTSLPRKEGMEAFYGVPSENKLGIVGNVAKSLFKQEPKTTELTEGKWKEEDGRQVFEGADGTYIGDYSKQRDGSFRAVDMFGREKKFDNVNDAKDYIYNSTNFHSTRQHSIDITPELKASVEGGQPLFKTEESKKEFGGFETRDGKPIGFKYDTEKVARERFDISKLKKIGSGSDRDVYDLGNGKVLKVAKTARGLTQNIYEGDYYLKGIIPEVFERGLNYVVAENTPRIKTSDVVETFDWDGNVIGKATAGEMLKELQKFSQKDMNNHDSKLQDVLAKYGLQDIMSYEVLWNDFIAQRNWGYKDGKAYHSDGGTFGGVDMIDSHEGKTNLSDPEFRKIYEESKRLKKQFGDTDKATMYSKEGGKVEAQYRIESGKNIVEAIKDFNGSPRATVALTHEIMHPTVVEIFNGAKEGNETGLRHANTIVEEYNKANPDKKVTVQQMIEGNDAFINGRTTPEYRAVQEFIAEAWEKYHHEGAKGFSKAFQEVLDAITEVFRQVYKSLTGTTLTPELRKMFDELLGKENVSEVVKAPEISSKAKNKFSNLREKIKQKQSLKIVSDEAENRHANSKLTEADNPVQEPNVKALESEGENAKNAAQAENVIIKIDSIISAATDVGLRKVSDISTDEKRFQGRDKLNAEKVQEIAENWKDADQDPIHVWTDPKDGKTYVLSGHHRLAAAKQAGREKVKVIDRSKDFTEEQAIRFAKEEANANRTMETAIERANTLRQKRERGDTKDDINKFLDREGKNKNFVNNLSRLNPKGKTIEALRATEKSDDKVTQKEVEKIADWIGEARDRNKNLTDAHENELFDFLMDREGSKRITTKQDFLSKVNSLAGAMDFNANEPLNIARYKHKTEGEKLYDKEVETQKGKISDLQQRINEINDRIKNPNNPQYLNPDSKDYEEIKKNADNKLSELNTELQAESKALLDLYQQKGKFARQGTEQSSLFSTEKNETELPEDYYNDLRDIIKDLKDEHKGITLDEIKEIAKNELGEYYSEPDIEAAYKMTEPQPPKSAPEPPKSAPSRPDKSVLTNIVNAENTPPEVKKKLTAHGLKYDPESHDEALQIARAVIDSLGIDAAVTEARARNFGGAVNTFIQTEALNALYKKEAQAKTAQEKYEAAEKFAEVSIALDEWARGDAGRGISALATFYQKSPLGMVLKENKSRKEEFNQWAKGKEESWDEFLERLNKTPEFSDYVSEKVQTELREERKKERSKFFKKVDDTLDKWINDLESGNVAFSSVVPPKLIAEALKGVKAAFKVGESATKIIGDAIDYISDKIGDNWDKDTFRAKIEKALNLRAEKTSVDRYADSLEKQIEELRKQIDAGKRNKNQSNKRPLTPKEQSLLDEKKRLQKELNDIDPKTTFAQRIQKQIDDIQRQIDAGKRDEKERKNKKEYSEKEKELQEKLKAKKAELEALSPLKNTESYKLAELDKFREKLKGLSEAEKDEVVSKAYKKLLDNGALDHADLREIIAKATGRGNLTEKQAARLQELNETINAAEIAKQKHLKERTEQTLKEYHKAIDMAAKAKRDLANEFDKKTDYLKVISSSIQGNTLGLLNVAVMNPLYNITTHLALRLPIGTVQSLFGLALGKAEMNTVFGKPMQAEFFGKGGRGFREAFKGLLTGMNKADYESKEIFSSQIRPNRSLRALLGKDNREAKMKLQEKLFHTFSVFPGATAETNFRLLNFGDKPMRYSASAATAAAFAKKYGIKFNTMDWKTFMEFPREIVKEIELAKGKSLKEAEQEAEYVVRSIEKEGERSTMQQDNLFSDMLEKVFSGGKHEGAKSLAKTLTISPFVKIPSNVLWLGYNLVHPQIALAQAAAHTIRSYGYRGKGEIAESKLQMREARYWMSVTMMGAALQAVMIPLIKAGIITAANDEDDSKKKRIADLTYQPQGMFNMTKFWAYLSGKNVNEVQGGFEIPLKYFGLPGALGNSLARDYKQLTPEQKENRRLLTDNLLELFDADDFKDIENGIFSSSSSLLQGLKGGDMTYYAGNMVNLFTNLIQPAAVSEFSRAAIPYRISGKFDSLGDKIKNDLSNRSALFRKLTGKYPKGKRNIWGEIIKKDDSYANRYFGFNNVTKDNFAQFIYEDAQKWDDEDFLPPTVSNSLGGKKLTAEQLDELEENIGLARKEFIRAYTNDIALIEELGKNYSDILGRDAKKAALKYLYQKGRKLGVDMFVSKHPEFENVVSEEEKQVEELLKDFKNLNLLSEDEVKEKIKGK